MKKGRIRTLVENGYELFDLYLIAGIAIVVLAGLAIGWRPDGVWHFIAW